MDENLLQICDHDGEGYRPLIDFGEWRVAILRYQDSIHPGNIYSMERHKETDEVFVLTKGKSVLIIGGNGSQADQVYPQVMETGKIFNVRRNTWHTILLSRDAAVLIVENRNTDEHNSEHTNITHEQHILIMDLARCHLPELLV
jgi:ureidoglycolate hydrolase